MPRSKHINNIVMYFQNWGASASPPLASRSIARAVAPSAKPIFERPGRGFMAHGRKLLGIQRQPLGTHQGNGSAILGLVLALPSLGSKYFEKPSECPNHYFCQSKRPVDKTPGTTLLYCFARWVTFFFCFLSVQHFLDSLDDIFI